jgi:class 3 adenylate cyclase
VVSVGASKDADVFGDAPNLAARVQEAAAPGTVVITEDRFQATTPGNTISLGSWAAGPCRESALPLGDRPTQTYATDPRDLLARSP